MQVLSLSCWSVCLVSSYFFVFLACVVAVVPSVDALVLVVLVGRFVAVVLLVSALVLLFVAVLVLVGFVNLCRIVFVCLAL